MGMTLRGTGTHGGQPVVQEGAALQEETLRPVALLPRRSGYRLFDPKRPTRGGQPIDGAGASLRQ